MSRVWWSMMSAWQYAEIGPFTSSPAAQLASSETVIFWSARVLETTTQTTTPATAMTIPATIDVTAATLRIAATSHVDPGVQVRGRLLAPSLQGGSGAA